MVRRTGVRGASVAVAALWAFAATGQAPAAAQDVESSSTVPVFTIALSLDDLVLETAASEESVVAAGEAPFAHQPAFRLGLPAIDGLGVRVRDRFPVRADAACEGGCKDLSARMAFRLHDDELGFSIGARAGLADRLPSFGDGGERPRWYLFVAADAQAMSWNFRNRSEATRSVRLDDMRLLGDAQAGVGARLGGGDLALGFVSREVEHMGAERTENFVGLTFGWEG